MLDEFLENFKMETHKKTSQISNLQIIEYVTNPAWKVLLDRFVPWCKNIGTLKVTKLRDADPESVKIKGWIKG